MAVTTPNHSRYLALNGINTLPNLSANTPAKNFIQSGKASQKKLAKPTPGNLVSKNKMKIY